MSRNPNVLVQSGVAMRADSGVGRHGVGFSGDSPAPGLLTRMFDRNELLDLHDPE